MATRLKYELSTVNVQVTTTLIYLLKTQLIQNSNGRIPFRTVKFKQIIGYNE